MVVYVRLALTAYTWATVGAGIVNLTPLSPSVHATASRAGKPVAGTGGTAAGSACATQRTTVRCGNTPSTVAGRRDQAYSVNVEPYTCGTGNALKCKRRRRRKNGRPRDDGAAEQTNVILQLPVFPTDGRDGVRSSGRVFEIPDGQLDLLYTVRRGDTATDGHGPRISDDGARGASHVRDPRFIFSKHGTV
jgi:hypothetical protein